MSYLTSVLDKSPIRDGGTPEQALRDSLRLAQHAEHLGYHRYWFAEHHATPQLASPAPEVLAAWVLAQTARIRVGISSYQSGEDESTMRAVSYASTTRSRH